MLFVATTTSTTAYYEITGKFWNMIKAGRAWSRGWLNIGLTLMLLSAEPVRNLGEMKRLGRSLALPNPVKMRE